MTFRAGTDEDNRVELAYLYLARIPWGARRAHFPYRTAPSSKFKLFFFLFSALSGELPAKRILKRQFDLGQQVGMRVGMGGMRGRTYGSG